MALSTSRRVIVVSFGAYIGLTLSWALLIDIVETILFRFQPTGSGDPETWATFATFVGPTTSFNYLLGEALNIGTVPPVADTSSAEFITPTVAILAFVAWAVLPVITGYLSFRQSDL